MNALQRMSTLLQNHLQGNQLTDVLLSIFSENEEDKIIETRELREVCLQKEIQCKFLF